MPDSHVDRSRVSFWWCPECEERHATDYDCQHRRRSRSEASAMLDEFHGALNDRRGRGNASLRVTLHEEEHTELAEALRECERDEKVLDGAPTPTSLMHLARELADVVYVAYGTAHAFAIDLDAALREIHRAAMSKVARSTRAVVREHGKVLKPPGFVPPDTTEVIHSRLGPNLSGERRERNAPTAAKTTALRKREGD